VKIDPFPLKRPPRHGSFMRMLGSRAVETTSGHPQGASGVHWDCPATHRNPVGYWLSITFQYAFVTVVELVLTDTLHVTPSIDVHVHCPDGIALL
jgi:hypothetical protein